MGGDSVRLMSEDDGYNQFPCYDKFESELMSAKDHVLVVGDYLKKPLTSLNEVPGFELVKQNLKEDLDVETGNSLQLHAASYILSGRNCFLIGAASSKAGKSLAYTIPIVSKLRHEAEKDTLPSGCGPVALIICATHKSGFKTEEALKWLTEDSKVEIEFAEEKDPEKQGSNSSGRFLSSFDKRCDIMVATAECAAAVVEDVQSWFSFDRLTYLVLDDAHILFKYRWEQVKTVLQAFKTYVDKVGERQRLSQVIVCGSQWSPEMEVCFTELTDNPVLVIGSSVQAIRFGNFGIQVVEVSKEEKFEKFTAILKKHEQLKRILVVAATWDILEELRNQCKEEEKLDILFLWGEGYIGAATAVAKRKWKESSDRVIVCTTDVNLREFQVKNAELLVHYDIPTDDIRTFALRFSAMWEIVEGRVRCRKEKKKIHESTLSYVLLDQALQKKHAIVWKLHKLGATIPTQLLEQAIQAREQSLDRISLCEGFVSAANCTELDMMECTLRHHFVPSDFQETPVLPLTGQVELLITEVKTPNMYTAKILRFVNRDPLTGKVVDRIDFSAEASRRHDALKEAAVSGSIGNGPMSVKSGAKVVVALRDKEDYRYVYTRAQVQEIVTRTAAGLPKSLQVRCLDVGLTKIVRVDDVFSMPPEMYSLPPCSVNVVLANTAPPYGEKKFRLAHISKAKDHFKLDLKFQAEISLSIGNTIWVRRLVKMKKISTGKVVEDWDATVTFCQQNILQRNPEHLNLLYKSCEESGFSCEIYRQKEKISWLKDTDFRLDYHQRNEPYQWAHVPTHNEGKSGVVSSTMSPKFIHENNYIYACLAEFDVLAERLENELSEEIVRLKGVHDWNTEAGFENYYETGLVVAAIDVEDNKYRRALVLNSFKQYGTGEQPLFDVLLVDLGVDARGLPMSSLYPIPKKFVSRLPFQAVKLKLSHIRSHRAVSQKRKMYRGIIELLFRNPVPDDVEVVAVRKVERTSQVDPNTYEAFVFGADAELGETLVAKKLARFVGNAAERVQQVKERLLEKFRAQIRELEDDEEPDRDDNEDDYDSDDFDFYIGQDLEDFCATFDQDQVSEKELSQKAIAAGEHRASTEGSEKYPVTPEVSTGRLQNGCAGSDGVSPLQKGSSTTKNPSVEWLQNYSFIFIRVLVPDISKWRCNVVERTNLEFESIDPPNYAFNLNLSKRVEGRIKVRPLGQYTEIKLQKRLPGVKWDVLTPKTGLRWLKPELSFGSTEEDDAEATKKVVETTPVDYEALCEEAEDDDDSDPFEDDDEHDELIN